MSSCIFCQIATSSTSTPLLHRDERVVAFPDIRPSAFRHYLVIPIQHIPTVNDLHRREEDYSLVSHMLGVGNKLLHSNAPGSEYRFGFHQPPFNSVDHLHLHCFALPFIPRWKQFKYASLGPWGFIDAEKLLARIKPLAQITADEILCMFTGVVSSFILTLNEFVYGQPLSKPVNAIQKTDGNSESEDSDGVKSSYQNDRGKR